MDQNNIRLEIRVEHPNEIMEDEIHYTTYHIRNLSNQRLGRTNISITMTWAMAPFFGVNHILEIQEISPHGEYTNPEPFQDRPMTPGMTLYTYRGPDEIVNEDGQHISLFTIDGGRIVGSKVIAGFKVRTSEEITQKRELKTAIYAVVISSVLQILNIILENWTRILMLFDP